MVATWIMRAGIITKRRMRAVLFPLVICTLGAPLVAADWLDRMIVSYGVKLFTTMAFREVTASLQNNSAKAIGWVYDRNNKKCKEPGFSGSVVDDFDAILSLTRQVGWLAYTSYDEPPAKKGSYFKLHDYQRGPGGFFATVLNTNLSGSTVPAGFPRPPGWGDKKGDFYPVTIISFRGTEALNDWRTNLLQAIGQRTEQFDFALTYGKQQLKNIPPKHLVVFTGHSLGGSLATYAALYFNRGAITFNSAGLHPQSFRRVVPNMAELKTSEITNVYHFLSHSSDGKTDIVGNVSFAGYSILPGAKYFINRDDLVIGKSLSLGELKTLHDMKGLVSKIADIDKKSDAQKLPPSQWMSCMEMHGREIYIPQ